MTPGELAVDRFAKLVLISALILLSLAAAALANINVTVKGNAFLKTWQIKEVLAPEPEDYKKAGLLSWQEDAQFYTSDLYRKSGYFDAKVDVDLKPDPKGKKDEWNAVLSIVEGVRYTFDSVRVVVVRDTAAAKKAEAGADTAGIQVDTAGVDTLKMAPPQDAPQPALILDTADFKAKAGKPYKEELIFQDRREVLQAYGNSGYVRAKVDDKVMVKAETKTVKVDYLVEPSYPVLFDTLLIVNHRAAPAESLMGITRDDLLRSLVKYDKKDTVRLSDNDKLIEKLQYTGAFNFVRTKDSLLDDPGHGSALILQLEERMPGLIRTSTFYDTYSGLGVSVDARHSNFAGTLNEVRGGAALATLRQSMYAGYGSPLTLGYMVRFDEDVSTNWYQDQPIHHQGTDSSSGYFEGDYRAVSSTRLTWPFSYWLRLTGNAELEAKSRMLGAASRERSLNLNFITTAAFSFLNQALDPTRGIRFAPSFGNGGPLLEDGEFLFTASRHNWLELQTGYYWYHPAVKQLKLALRLDGGRFFGEGGTNSDRFFLGGGRSVRSYGFQGLCPEVEVDTTAGETVCSTQDQTLAYFLTSYELRFAPFGFHFVSPRGPLKHFIPLEIVPFYDFGKVWNVDKGFALDGSNDAERQSRGQGVAMGVGLRYPILGLFNFRFDVAYGRPGKSNWPDAWVIDLAQAF
jgi:outer membrane protein assembly factor BamA